jgi:hypothetical protein
MHIVDSRGYHGGLAIIAFQTRRLNFLVHAQSAVGFGCRLKGGESPLGWLIDGDLGRATTAASATTAMTAATARTSILRIRVHLSLNSCQKRRVEASVAEDMAAGAVRFLPFN